MAVLIGKAVAIPKGEWNAATSYDKYNIAYYTDGHTYIALEANNNIVPPDNPDKWVKLVDNTASLNAASAANTAAEAANTAAAGANAVKTEIEQALENGDFDGPAGPKGDDGQSPTITIGTVTKGDAAAATLTGTYPNYVLNLTLPKGDTGPTGADGQSPTLAIGTVQTGSAGSDASASMSGNYPNYELNLTIPRGENGADGVDGANGISPTVEVSKTGKVTTITITDATGPHTATINDGADGSGTGDMVRATYDANENGIVDDAEKLGGQLPAYYASMDDLAEKASLPVSDTPPEDSEFWVDTGVSPTMLRRWRGADVPTGREYQQTISADTGSASLSIDNAQGQVQSVAVEAGCRAQQEGTGDPSPENIRAISGHESVEIAACGKNLFEAKQDVFNGSPTPTLMRASDQTTSMLLEEVGNEQYVFAFDLETHDLVFADDVDDSQKRIGIEGYATRADGTNVFLSSWASVANGKLSTNTTARIVTVEQKEAGEYILTNPMYIYAQNVASGTWSVSNIQLELGPTATAYEPYRSMGGGTVTPTEPLYGLPGAEDTAEVSTGGDVLVTRRTEVIVLDGTENISLGNIDLATTMQQFNVVKQNNGAGQPQICSHFINNYNVISGNALGFTIYSINIIVFGIERSLLEPYGFVAGQTTTYTTAFKSWLSAQSSNGTPVTVLYELAEPTTETLSPIDPILPQAGTVNIITDADTLSATVTGSGWDTIGDMGGLEAQLTAKADAADLAAVATSGSYNDLNDKPTIPPAVTIDSTITEGGTNPVTGGAIYTALVGKVDAESGKGLSTNDYTSAEKQKLAGIAAGANNYVHPSTHPASMITGLATVAASGSYNDLADKPTIPPAVTIDSTITEGGTNPVTGGAIYTALAGKADAGDIPTGLLQSAFHGTVSLLSTGWTQGDDSWYSQTVTATGVTATAIVYVAFHPDSRSAFLDAGIYCSAQAANQLTFKAASQPESNISVNVHAMEVSA